MEIREVRIKECLQLKTCERHWDADMKAWVIAYKSPNTKTGEVPESGINKISVTQKHFGLATGYSGFFYNSWGGHGDVSVRKYQDVEKYKGAIGIRGSLGFFYGF